MFGRFLFYKNPTCMIVSNQKININMMRLLDYARSDYIITRLGYNRHRRSHETHLLARYAVASLLTPYAERSNPIKTHTIIKHFHSIFKVNHIHSKKSIHLLTAVFLSRNGLFFYKKYISRATVKQCRRVSLSILFLE